MIQGDLIDRVVVTEQDIQRCVRRVAGDVEQAYGRDADVLAIVVLTGAKWFAADVAAHAGCRFDVRPIRARSYYGGTESVGTVSVEGCLGEELSGRDVLLIDDIYDTGRTLQALIELILAQRPRSLRTCVMFEKARPHEQQVTIDFLGATVPDEFVVGYGLDYQQQYRELPYVGVLDVSKLTASGMG